MSQRSIRRWTVAAGAAAIVATPVVACGPFFPNQLLFEPGRSVTWAPVADLRREMHRLAPASALRAVPPGKQDVYEQTVAAAVADLRDALDVLATPQDKRADVVR